MKWYNYLITRDTETFHTGYTKDVVRCAAEYKKIPSMNWPPRPNSLVYLEEQKTEPEARNRLNEIVSMTKAQKIALVEATNPGWVVLEPGKNITL